MNHIDIRWAVTFAVAVLGFLIGGGTLGKYVAKAHWAAMLEDLYPHFDKRYAAKGIELDMARHREDVTNFQQRLQERILDTMERMESNVERHGSILAEHGKALYEQSKALALAVQELRHVVTDQGALRDEVRAVRANRDMQREKD